MGPLSEIHFSLWRSPCVDGLEVVESSAHDSRYPWHLHEAMEIIWMRQGSGIIECRNQRRLLRAGEACVIRPYEPHCGGALGRNPMKFCLIHIPYGLAGPGFLTRNFRSAESGKDLPLRHLSRAAASRVLPGLIETLMRDNGPVALYGSVAAALDEMLASEGRRHGPPGRRKPQHPAVEHVKSIIRYHYAEPLNVEALASEVALNERYLISLFRQVTGIPPHQFQIAVRIDHARRMLPSSTPLSTIATASGFADQSHLNRHFKRQYGFTPGVFRRMFLPA